jgi:hypothetical protein
MKGQFLATVPTGLPSMGGANFLNQFPEMPDSLLGKPQESLFPIWWRGTVRKGIRFQPSLAN